MSLRLVCDTCGRHGAPDAQWLLLRRRQQTTAAYAIRTWGGSDDEPPKDTVLGDGLTFHNYDCLQLWLVQNAPQETT